MPNRPAPAVRADQLASAHVAVAGLASALVPVLAIPDHDVLRVTLLAAHAAATVQLFRRVRRPWPCSPRPPWGAPPPSGQASCSPIGRPTATRRSSRPSRSLLARRVAAWYAIARRVWGDGGLVVSRADRRLAVAATTTIALLWGAPGVRRGRLADVWTFLVIGYFAVTGSARSRSAAHARCPPRARWGSRSRCTRAQGVVEASALDAIGLRVGSYLLVGGFLLAVGYWYRAAGARTAVRSAEPDAPDTTAPDATAPDATAPDATAPAPTPGPA